MARTAKKRTGRPPKPPERRRGSLTIRLRDSTRASLEVAAERHLRSLSEEIESLIEKAADAERYRTQLLDLWFGQEVAALIQLLAQSLHMPGDAALWGPEIGRKPDERSADEIARLRKGWIHDGPAFAVAQRVLNTVLSAIRPPGGPMTPTADHDRLVWAAAIKTITDIADRKGTGPLVGLPERLGPDIAERAKAFLGRTQQEEDSNG